MIYKICAVFSKRTHKDFISIDSHYNFMMIVSYKQIISTNTIIESLNHRICYTQISTVY